MNNDKNRDIFIALGTVLAMTFLLPVFDGLGSFVTSAINNKINQWQLKFQIDQAKAQEEIEFQPPVNAIGFEIPNEEICEDYEDE